MWLCEMTARNFVHAVMGASIASALLLFAIYLVTSALGVPDVLDFLVFETGLNFVLVLVGIPAFLGWFRRREDRARLSALECMILGVIGARLVDPVRDVWDQQVMAIRRVHRSSDGFKVSFDMRGIGRNPYLPLPLLPKRTTFVIATVRLNHPGLHGAIDAMVACEAGRLSSIEFSGGSSMVMTGEVLTSDGWEVVVSRVDDFQAELHGGLDLNSRS